MVPFDEQSPMVTSGVRIGTAAMSSRGINEDDSRQIVDWIDRMVQDIHNDDVRQTVKEEVHAMTARLPLY